MRTNEKVLVGLALFCWVPPPLQIRAQEVAREPVHHQHVISANPLLLLAGSFHAEYERKLAETLTAGIGGGWWEQDEDSYTNVSGFLRYYPQEAAFTGFYLGGQAGIYRVDDGTDSGTAFGIGVDIGFAWLLGPGRSFYVGLGIGAARLLSQDLGDASSVVPSVRILDVGIAF